MSDAKPWVGFSAHLLQDLRSAAPGQLIDCPSCSGQHALELSELSAQRVEAERGISGVSDTMLVYRCGDQEFLGGVAGKLVVGVEPDVSSERPRHHHCACAVCWSKNNPGRTPQTVPEPRTERCCWCGRQTRSGIYVFARSAEAHCPPKN